MAPTSSKPNTIDLLDIDSQPPSAFFTASGQALLSSKWDCTENIEAAPIPWDTADTESVLMVADAGYTYPTTVDSRCDSAAALRLLGGEDFSGSSPMSYSFSEPIPQEISNSISEDYSMSPMISRQSSYDLAWSSEPRSSRPTPSHSIWQWYDDTTGSWYWRILPTFSEVSDEKRLKESITCKNYTSGNVILCKGECLSDWILEDTYDGVTSYTNACRVPGCNYRLPTEQLQ